MIGKLDRYVELEAKTNLSQDVMGQASYDWTTITFVWAKMDHRSGVESYIAQRESNVDSVYWIIRYRDDIDESWRLKYEEKEYEIHAIKAIDRKRYIEVKTLLIK